MGATAVTPAAPPRKGPLGGVSARLLRVASDEKLVAAVRQGSQPAFEVVYDRHHRGILSFCRHMLGSREEAEDAVQHTFMAAYKALLESEKDIQLKAWLYTIARNRCLSVLRARREQPSDEIEIASVDGLAAEVQRKQDLQDLLVDLAELPEDQRAALVLSELGDLGHDEIGRVLGVPKDKVKALVFQARSSLQQSRDARDTSCEEIRELLATLSGGALRRTTLRRHLKSCPGCQAFEAEVKRQRRAMAAVLPVVPTIGLKDSALAAAFGQSAAGGAAVAGGVAATTAATGAGTVAGGTALGGGASALVAKALVVAAVAGGGAAGVSAVSGDGDRGGRPGSTPAAESGTPSGGGPAAPAAVATAEAQEQTDKVEEDKPRKSRKGRARGKDDRGKEFAKDRGKGKKRGLDGTQPGQQKKKAAEEKKERAKERAAERKARAKVREQKAKARTHDKVKRQRPAKQPPAKKPRPSEEPEEQQEPQGEPQKPPKPEPKPEPTPTPVPSATPDATPDGGGGGGKKAEH